MNLFYVTMNISLWMLIWLLLTFLQSSVTFKHDKLWREMFSFFFLLSLWKVSLLEVVRRVLFSVNHSGWIEMDQRQEEIWSLNPRRVFFCAHFGNRFCFVIGRGTKIISHTEADITLAQFTVLFCFFSPSKFVFVLFGSFFPLSKGLDSYLLHCKLNLTFSECLSQVQRDI